MNWFDDDICWCGNSEECGITECFRHISNRRPQPLPDVFTMANFKGSIDCPYYEEEVELGESVSIGSVELGESIFTRGIEDELF